MSGGPGYWRATGCVVFALAASGLASGGPAQQPDPPLAVPAVLARPVALRPGNRPLGEILAELSRQSRLPFSYSSSLIPVGHRYRLAAGPPRPLGIVLREVLATTHLSYGLLDGQLVLWPAQAALPAGVTAVNGHPASSGPPLSNQVAFLAKGPGPAYSTSFATKPQSTQKAGAPALTAGPPHELHRRASAAGSALPTLAAEPGSSVTKAGAPIHNKATSPPTKAAGLAASTRLPAGQVRPRSVVRGLGSGGEDSSIGSGDSGIEVAASAGAPGTSEAPRTWPRTTTAFPAQSPRAPVPPTRRAIGVIPAAESMEARPRTASGVRRALLAAPDSLEPLRARPVFAALDSTPLGAPHPGPLAGPYPARNAVAKSIATVPSSTPLLAGLRSWAYLHGEAWASESMPLGATVKVGVRTAYLVLGAALAPAGHHHGAAWGVGLGTASRARGRFTPSLDLLLWWLNGDGDYVDRTQLTQLRPQLAWQFKQGGRWQLVGGPTLNLATARRTVGAQPRWPVGLDQWLWFESLDDQPLLRLWPGVQLGLRF